MITKISLEILSRMSDAEIQRELEERRDLQRSMVGSLYPGILQDEIALIVELWQPSRNYQEKLDLEIVAKFL